MNSSYWCIALASNLGSEFEGRDGVVLSERFDTEDDVSLDNLDYYIWCRTRAPSEDTAHDLVREILEDHGVQGIESIQTATTDPRALVRSERRIGKGLPPESVSFNTVYVGFKSGDRDAMKQAERVMKLACFRARWQFWK